MPTGSVFALKPDCTPPTYSVTVDPPNAGAGASAITIVAAIPSPTLDLMYATVQTGVAAQGISIPSVASSFTLRSRPPV
jgi:hypothetical protein